MSEQQSFSFNVGAKDIAMIVGIIGSAIGTYVSLQNSVTKLEVRFEERMNNHTQAFLQIRESLGSQWRLISAISPRLATIETEIAALKAKRNIKISN